MTQKIKKFSYKTNGFTLVELIIVITILAILATIAFISFQGYSGNARDGNKLTTLSNIETGLNLYQVKT
ncbi:MAG: type II secretion system protein [Candidatus Altimarinota bacterium]